MGSRWDNQGWLSRQADAFEVAAYSGRLGERCDDAQAPSVMAALAESERDVLSERIRSGIAAARAKGKHIGRRPGQRIKSDRLATQGAGVKTGRIFL